MRCQWLLMWMSYQQHNNLMHKAKSHNQNSTRQLSIINLSSTVVKELSFAQKLTVIFIVQINFVIMSQYTRLL